MDDKTRKPLTITEKIVITTLIGAGVFLIIAIAFNPNKTQEGINKSPTQTITQSSTFKPTQESKQAITDISNAQVGEVWSSGGQAILLYKEPLEDENYKTSGGGNNLKILKNVGAWMQVQIIGWIENPAPTGWIPTKNYTASKRISTVDEEQKNSATRESARATDVVSNQQTTTAESKKPKKIASKMTSVELAYECEKSPDTIKEKYKDTYLEVTGKVFEKWLTDPVLVLFGKEKYKGEVLCDFGDNTSQFNAIPVDQQVTVKGKFFACYPATSSVELEFCSLLK